MGDAGRYRPGAGESNPPRFSRALLRDGCAGVRFAFSRAIVAELARLPSLPFAVGVYLPVSTMATVFAGGLLRWVVERFARGDDKKVRRRDQGVLQHRVGLLHLSERPLAGGTAFYMRLDGRRERRACQGIHQVRLGFLTGHRSAGLCCR